MNELYEKVFWDDSIKLSDRKIFTGFVVKIGEAKYKEEITAKDLIIQKIYFAKEELMKLKNIDRSSIKELKQLSYLFNEYYETHFGKEQILFGQEFESIEFIKNDLKRKISIIDSNIKTSDIKKLCENIIKNIIKDDYKYQRRIIKEKISLIRQEKNRIDERVRNSNIQNLKYDLTNIPRKIDISSLLNLNGLSTNKDYKTNYKKIGLV